MDNKTIQAAIAAGDTALGIELGSTKIKAVLLTKDFVTAATGSHDWESAYENGVWTYSLDAVWDGLRDCYRALAQQVEERYGIPLKRVGCMGVSAMMHGYLPFDREDRLLTPFRTWQNTSTGPAAAELSELFQFNIPQRWSVAHLYQAILNGEDHVKDIDFLTTLAGYVHWQLTGKKVLGIGDASGMFPIDSDTGAYDAGMLRKFAEKTVACPWQMVELLPKVLAAGEQAGTLTEAGARRLDPSGNLAPGIPFCPPEGDAGTGMAATNAVAMRTGNVSAGTSIFSMVVLERPLRHYYPEIDMVTTPTGRPVAMVHCNNCTSDMNAWAGLLGEFADMMGLDAGLDEIYPRFYKKALEGDPDCGGLLLYNFVAGEPVAGVSAGRPLLVRGPGSRFTLANFCRASLYATMATLKIGMDLLSKQEHVTVERLVGHGGLFRHAGVGAKFLAAATGAPVLTMETASVGGPYGMALLAAYAVGRTEGETLEAFLNWRVFSSIHTVKTEPDTMDVAGFDTFLESFRAGLPVEQAAEHILE